MSAKRVGLGKLGYFKRWVKKIEWGVMSDDKKKIQIAPKLKFQFCAMCPKLFILKEFYFLLLELNVRPHHKYSFKWVIKYKNQIV